MTNTYLLEVIKALQPNERQKMALFLNSPYFNMGNNAKEVIHLYQIILNAAPEFSEILLDKETVYFQVFSEYKVVPGKLEKLMSDLNKLLRRFALCEQYFIKSNENLQQVDWAKWLRERRIADRSQQIVTKMKAQIKHEKSESLERYRTNLLIAEEEHEWESIHNQAKGDLNIPELIYHLDLHYHTYRTELANRYLLQQKAAQLLDLEMVETRLDYDLGDSILLNISKKIYNVLKKDSPTVGDFQEMIELLRTNEKTLSFQTLAQLYVYLRNSCTMLINAGSLEFIPILHEMHKDNLPRGYFFVNGAISPNVYLNIVQIATRAKEFDWAKEFTENYKGSIIGGDEEQFFYRLNIAQYLFAQGNFDDALVQIPDVQSASYYQLIARRLEIKIYYELHSDLLLYKMDAFRKFIERTAPKTVEPTTRALHINFLNLLLQLSQSPMKDKARSVRLTKRIEEKKFLADRGWLLEKARELG